MLAEILVLFLFVSQSQTYMFDREQNQYHELTDEERQLYNNVRIFLKQIVNQINRGRIDLPREAKDYVDYLNRVNSIQVKVQGSGVMKYHFKV